MLDHLIILPRGHGQYALTFAGKVLFEGTYKACEDHYETLCMSHEEIEALPVCGVPSLTGTGDY